MFLIPAGTVIQVQAPESQSAWYDTIGWRPYTTKEDKLYDTEEVYDLVAVLNGTRDVPAWAERNIVEHGYVVLHRGGRWALVRAQYVTYLD